MKFRFHLDKSTLYNYLFFECIYLDVIVQLTSGIIKVPFSLKWVRLSNTFSSSLQNKIPCLNEKKSIFFVFSVW